MRLAVRLVAVLSIVSLCLLVSSPAMADDSGSSIVGGKHFSISITGDPNTVYYIWPTNTQYLTGEIGDQPPTVTGAQYKIEKDPEGGPYTIGSYRFSNGGGDTIQDVIPPSTSDMSNTNYYAAVTTDSDGLAVVEFTTSSATAKQHYSYRVENPANPTDSSFKYQLGTISVQTPTVSIFAKATITPPVTAGPVTPVYTETLPETPAVVATAIVVTPSATATPSPLPSKKVPVEGALIVTAVAGAFLLAARRQ